MKQLITLECLKHPVLPILCRVWDLHEHIHGFAIFFKMMPRTASQWIQSYFMTESSTTCESLWILMTTAVTSNLGKRIALRSVALTPQSRQFWSSTDGRWDILDDHSLWLFRRFLIFNLWCIAGSYPEIVLKNWNVLSSLLWCEANIRLSHMIAGTLLAGFGKWCGIFHRWVGCLRAGCTSWWLLFRDESRRLM